MTGHKSKDSTALQQPTGTVDHSEAGQFHRPEHLEALPEVVVYQDHDYGGESYRTNLNFQLIPKDFNDKISSIVIVRGTWRFYREPNFHGDYWDLPVGYYPTLGSANNQISSFQCIKY